MTKTKKRLLIIDANALIHRAFHALPPLTAPKGEQVGAVYGFLLELFRALKEFHPSYVAAAFDMAGPTFRHRAFEGYKATRKKAPDELYAQIDRIKKVLEVLGVATLELKGFEADDVIGTIALKVSSDQGSRDVETIILTGDLDPLQLVRDRIMVSVLRHGSRDSVLYDAREVEKKFGGLTPSQLPDYKGLRGDASDNIPGVKGIGEKTATDLLLKFTSLEHLYEMLQKSSVPEGMSAAVAPLLRDQKEAAMMSKDLGTIRTDLPLRAGLKDMKWNGFDLAKAEEEFQSLGFRSLAGKLGEFADPFSVEKEEKHSRPSHILPSDHLEETKQKISLFAKEGIFSKEIYELELALLPVIASMEAFGIGIEKEHFYSLAKEMSADLAKLEDRVYQKAGARFNINSPSQLSEVLFEKLGLASKGIKKTPKGVLSTASDELEKLRGSHPVVEDIVSYRELHKLLTTYITPLPLLADGQGRIHSTFDPLGAASGRMSSSSPNLQNIPIQGNWAQRIREGFVPAPGYSFLSCDYSQIELRMVAHVAQEEKMISFFQRGQDIHRITASEVFDVPLKDVTDEIRGRAKALNFGVIYGMGPKSFAQNTGVSMEEAQNFIDQYFTRFPGIAAYIERQKIFAREHGYVETLFGRKRFIPEIASRNARLRAAAERIAVNHPLQGTVADLMKMAMVRVFHQITKGDQSSRMILQIHDELLFECADDIILQTADRVMRVMNEIYALRVPLSVRAKIGKNWGEMTPL